MENLENPGDTIYSTSEETPAFAVRQLREAASASGADVLSETSAEARRNELLSRAQRRPAPVRVVAKSAVSVLDNLDALLGVIERIFLVALTDLVRRGDWISAGLVCLLAGVAWIWKIRRPAPGPAVSFFRKDSTEIRARLVSAAKTVYRG